LFNKQQWATPSLKPKDSVEVYDASSHGNDEDITPDNSTTSIMADHAIPFTSVNHIPPTQAG